MSHRRFARTRRWLSTAPLIALVLSACGASNSPSSEDPRSDSAEPAETVVQDLAPGDCFNTDVGGGELNSVEITACTDRHRFEVVSVLTYGDVEKPADNDLVSWARPQCESAIDDIVGGDTIEYRLAFAIPSEVDWTELGDRNVICIHDAGAEPVTFNLANIPQPEDEEPLLAADDAEEPSTDNAPATEETDAVDSTTQRPETEVSDDATVDSEPVEYNLSKYRICLHFNESLIGSSEDEDCDSGVIAEADPKDCPRGVLETWTWSYDSYDCEASIYFAFWEHAVSTSYDTSVKVDGIYTREDYLDVKQFQRDMGLDADSFIGPATWAAVSEFDCPNQSADMFNVCGESASAAWKPGAPIPSLDEFPAGLRELLE